MTPFGDAALALRERGLAVFPCGGSDGKRPGVYAWQKSKRSAETIAEWARKRPDANIGVACGPSGVVVVDVDKPELVEPMLKRFGDTPLITRTPSGGAHLWYRKDGVVKSKQGLEGLKVDIRADGGYVLVPPSRNPQSGKPYVFERGSWGDLERLPPFRNEALPAGRNKTRTKSAKAQTDTTGKVLEGGRDIALFRHLMQIAPSTGDLDALIAAGHRFNEATHWPPFSRVEVEEKARHVWSDYQEIDQNWIGDGRPRVVLLGSVVDDLLRRRHGPDALAMLALLIRSHGARDTSFAVCSKAMARDEVIAGWTSRRYTRARRLLESSDLIVLVSPSRCDSGRWTAAEYRFARPGAISAPNITQHPSPPLSR